MRRENLPRTALVAVVPDLVEPLLPVPVKVDGIFRHAAVIYDPEKAQAILEILAGIKRKEEQLTALWAIDRWPEEMRGLLSLGEDTKSLRTGLFIPLWWRYLTETRLEYLKGHKHGKRGEVFWGTGQEFLLAANERHFGGLSKAGQPMAPVNASQSQRPSSRLTFLIILPYLLKR